MQNFEYARPETLAAAAALLNGSRDEVEILAGGTDLLARMKDCVSTPRRIVNLKGLRDLNLVRTGADATSIGALTTLDNTAGDPHIRHDYPLLAEAAANVGGPQIRAMGTIGGNLCQRPRCWYYRAGFGLLARDASGKSLVPEGENRYHAILGNAGPAYYVHPSTTAPALIALDAKARLYGPNGTREVSLAQFFVTPKSENERENGLQPGEILTEIVLPASSRGARAGFYKVAHKFEMEWPLATAAVSLVIDAQRVRSARIVLGHVAPVPWPAPEAEKAIVGQIVDADSARKAAEAAVAGARPLSQNGYKVQLARVAVARALLAAVGKGV